MNDFSILNDYLSDYNIFLSDDQIDMFNEYYNILIEWNSFMNLTALTEFNDVVIKHFVDSIASAAFIDYFDKSLIDVGTGAGFPGIPLKIAFPSINVTLMDSLNKRVKFLNEVIEKLSLKGIEAIHSRAEDLAHNPKYRENFDFSVSRAVSNLSTLSEYCIPFVKDNGCFVSYKSEKATEEIKTANKAINILNSKIEIVHEYVLPKTDINRTLVVIRKQGPIKSKYPRKAGIPTKEPL